MIAELYLEGNRVDMDANISALLNFALADIKDFSARSTTWSKTIVLPGTANNNQLFGHIFQVGQSNSHDPDRENVGYNFNAAKSADCIIFQDQIQAFKGVLRMLQVNIYKGYIEYEVSVFGKLHGLNVALSSSLLEDLDFSSYDHVYNDANIVASWDNPGGSGYYYPLIDYGTYSTNKHDWDIRTFRPALYVKEYIDKLFAAAGFRYESDLVESDRFCKLIIPHNAKSLTVNKVELGKAGISNAQHYTFNHAGDDSKHISWDTYSGTGFTTEALKRTFTYAGTVTTNIIIEGYFDVNFTGVAFFYSVTLNIYKNGKTGTLLYSVPWIFSPTTIAFNLTASIAPGDTIEFWFAATADVLNITSANLTFKSASGSMAIPISIGDTVEINTTIPKNIRQIDFLIGLVKLFNLYVYEDKFDANLIHMVPYINFYSTDQNTSVDWTYKMDRDQAIKVRPMSELTAKIYGFKFTQDSDYYNELYRKRYNLGYGDRVYDSQFEFADQKKDFEIIFSSTPLVGYVGEEKVFSTIFKLSNNVEENVDSNIRILQSKKINLANSWNITTDNGATVLNTLTRYGYAGHFDDPDAPNNDLNFGAPRELFFILSTGNLSNNQFNVYWSGYMAEITDKDSKLLAGKFYLTATDIAQLDFSKYVYLDGVLYRLNSIKDYNASKPSTCTVELLKVNELNFTQATPPEGPPDGNFLLWSNENILYHDDVEDGNELLWRGDLINPSINYTFTKNLPSGIHTGTMRIRKNGVTVMEPSSFTSGTLVVSVGDVIEVRVRNLTTISKGLTVISDIDGTLYDQPSGSTEKIYTWTVEDENTYTVTASIN